VNSIATLGTVQGRAGEAIASVMSGADSRWKRWGVVALYAAAMAWVESAVVFYIRYHINRLVPYQPDPLPIVNALGTAEIVRELATMIMLATVGWLAGRNWRTRIGFSLLAFGIWDIAYYVWLVPLTGWPQSITDWDILFLIPLPWWGPVWSPVSIAILMVLYGTIVCAFDSEERPLKPSALSCVLALIGGCVALYVFMTDSLHLVLTQHSIHGLRSMLPQWFNWPLFLIGFGLLAAPIVSVWARAKARETPGLDCQKWIAHFRRNRENRVEPDWHAPMTLSPAQLTAVLPSITQFQLGDGGGDCRLIAFDAERFRGQSEDIRRLVDLWFAEEAGHARLLGCAVDRLGGKRIQSHWSFTAFCQVRRWLGVRFELQVLTLTELVSTAYYRVLQRHVNDAPIKAMCGLILRDEAGHVAFQRERLIASGCITRGISGTLWRAQFWILGHAAAATLWLSHGPCLTPLGAARAEYFGEVRRHLRRFIVALGSHSNALSGRQGRPSAEYHEQLFKRQLA
jgi:hypothetical protein